MNKTATSLSPSDADNTVENPTSRQEPKLSTLSKVAQALSNPISAPEYLADKVIGGLITVGCTYAVAAVVEKVQEARSLKREVTARV